jgi:HAD superfamily hydrolase (TIGR01509 family)
LLASFPLCSHALAAATARRVGRGDPGSHGGDGKKGDDVPSSTLLIFDCDGVLIDSEMIACRAEAAYLAEIGIPVSAEEILERYLGISMAVMLADLESRHGQRPPGLPPDFADTLRRRTAAAFDAGLHPMPGIETALQMLPHPRCVASSSAPERLRHSLRLTGLLPHFDPHIFSATQVARGKPAPDLFLFAAARMDATPGACVAIEDSVPGVQAAVAAGMRVIGFIGGSHCLPGHAERLRAAGASTICDAMAELGAVL